MYHNNLKGNLNLLSIYTRHIQLAHSEAWKSNFKTKMSCLLIRGGSLISVGHNYILSSKKAYFGCSIHAELDAILSCRTTSENCKALIYRFTRQHNLLASSEPCEKCNFMLTKAGVKSIIAVDSKLNLFKRRL